MERRAEQWRIEQGYSYQDLADMAGCSRQYAWNLCHNGTAGITRALKIIAISAGQLNIFDFVSDEEEQELREILTATEADLREERERALAEMRADAERERARAERQERERLARQTPAR